MKKHVRRTVRDPFAWISKTLPLAQDQQRDIGIAYHASLQAMLNGHGSEQTWGTLACAMNVGLLLAEQGFCAGAIETIKLGQDALMSSKARAARVGKWAFDGDSARIVMATTSILDEQIRLTTRSQIAEALREVHRRIEIGEVMELGEAAQGETFRACGVRIGEVNQEPCIGCQQAQQRISNGANGKWTQCHMCRCVWVHKSSAVGWTEAVNLRHENIKRPNEKVSGAGTASAGLPVSRRDWRKR